MPIIAVLAALRTVAIDGVGLPFLFRIFLTGSSNTSVLSSFEIPVSSTSFSASSASSRARKPPAVRRGLFWPLRPGEAFDRGAFVIPTSALDCRLFFTSVPALGLPKRFRAFNACEAVKADDAERDLGRTAAL